MDTLKKTADNTEFVDKIPSDLSILPLRNTVAYPFAILPLVVGVPRSINLIENALQKNRVIGLVATKDPSIEEPQPGQIYRIGTVAKIVGVERPITRNKWWFRVWSDVV
jgi:ATP-dependent Lon protease